MNDLSPVSKPARPLAKYEDKYRTADGSVRASVPFSGARTLWFNTGTLCNIECLNCYILSSPENDALTYLNAAEVADYLEQIENRAWPVREIGFTGGEPFMNPDIIPMIEASLMRGYEVLVLTNAMRPMMRKRVQSGLLDLNSRFPGKLTLRVSLDHYRARENDEIRGAGSYDTALKGMDWIRDQKLQMTVAGRTIWNENEAENRAAFADLFASRGYAVEASNPAALVLFPEMDLSVKVPEITIACWGILNKNPEETMCATSRMVVKRKGAKSPVVLACTLLAYEPEFELGSELKDTEDDVHLNHPHCAKFCVLGGASCSA